MPTTYPKTESLAIGYDPKEDRVVLTTRLQDGESRKTYITRRLLARMVEKIKAELTSTHPAAHRAADPDEVLRMEHIAAVGQVITEKSGDKLETENLSPSEPSLVTEVQIETRDHHLMMGLLAEDKKPLAGISLPRDKAHQVLRMLMKQAEKADWKIGDSFFVQKTSPEQRVH